MPRQERVHICFGTEGAHLSSPTSRARPPSTYVIFSFFLLVLVIIYYYVIVVFAFFGNSYLFSRGTGHLRKLEAGQSGIHSGSGPWGPDESAQPHLSSTYGKILSGSPVMPTCRTRPSDLSFSSAGRVSFTTWRAERQRIAQSAVFMQQI